uniref:Rho GTPase-activating protein 27-like n=1 Tax=Sinocyclocheilus anshuiensis TaxID=1608454 RepID=A0A671KJ45_9TELE
MSLSQQVLVNYEYKYTARDGREVSIKPNEHYMLVAKTNETWWHVRRDGTDKPFFIPATYVTELPPETNQTSLHPSVEFSGSESLKSNSETAPDSLPTIIEPAEVTLRSSKPASPTNGETPPSILLKLLHTVNTPQSPELEIKSTVNATERPRVDTKALDQDIQMGSLQRDHHFWVPLASCLVQVYAFMGVIFVHQVEDDSALTAVYVNLPRVRRNTPDTLLLDSAGWEIHTDDQSGQEYYYHPSTGRSTWEYPLSYSMESSVGTEEARSPPSFPQSPISSPLFPSPQRWSSDWEKVLDENTGRHYFFNIVSGQSSWDPPEDIISPEQFLEDCPVWRFYPPFPEEDYPASPDLEEASPLSMPSEYTLIHVKKVSIPRASLDHSVPPGWTLSIDPEGAWVFTSDYTQEQWIKSLDDRGRTYYYLRDGSKSQWNLPEVRYSGKIWDCPPKGLVTVKTVMFVCKSITFYKSSHRKNWSNSWTVLHGGILTFHKDPKTPAGASVRNKTSKFPEFTVELKGATINRATKDKSSKKNVLELKSRSGVEYLIQYDTESIITDWYKIITDTIRQLVSLASEKSSSLDREDRPFDKRTMSNASRHPSSSSTPEADQKKVRTKLKKFLLKRPTLQSVKDKGYIRENVFGCHLHNLCIQEKTRVPSFVEKCIRAVEKRGLEIDGLYRVSGNLAVIQKLRFKADHEDLDLEEGNWDIHVITGALKLFFRELQEPLFPYSLFNDFINGIKIPDYYSKIAHMRNLVRSLPPPNRNTMEALFSHLRKVIQHGDENRMSVQNVAIVFGPTLLKPEVETANIAAYMVFQNQIVEFLLNEFESIFHM